MLPLIHDWTRGRKRADGDAVDTAAHIFADDVAEGTYFAAIDLFAQPNLWYPKEYSEPDWSASGSRIQRPPMYVAALGSNSPWPVMEGMEPRYLDVQVGKGQVTLPFEAVT